MNSSFTVKRSREDLIFDILNYLVLGSFLLIVLYPLYFIVIASISDPSSVLNGEVILLPKDLDFSGYKKIFDDQSIWRGYYNTFVYTILGTILNVMLTMGIGYPLSRKYFSGRKAIMIYLMITMYFGGGQVPYYMVLKNLGLLDTFWVFIFPLIMSVYNMILIRSYIESMPDELFEAVKIDGGNDLVVYWKIIIPLAKPILMTVALFVAINQWNSWFDAYLYTSSENLKPMQSILVEILNQYNTGATTSAQMSNAKSGMTITPDSLRMAATMIATIPIICVYPFIQKYFVKGIMLGAVKG